MYIVGSAEALGGLDLAIYPANKKKEPRGLAGFFASISYRFSFVFGLAPNPTGLPTRTMAQRKPMSSVD